MERVDILKAMENIDSRLDDPALNALLDAYPRPRGPKRVDHPYYYRFLHKLAPKIGTYLELGCRTGAAAYHVALGNKKTQLHVVDHRDKLCVYHPNIHFHLNDTRDPFLPKYINKTFDVIFVDSEHTYEQVTAEYNLWRPYVSPGGVMLFDDIVEYPGLQKFWLERTENKLSAPTLHPFGWGFGILFC